MDEFAEIRRLQRWGHVDRLLHLALIAGMVIFLSVLIVKELRGGHA
jgi:hypothetical protein